MDWGYFEGCQAYKFEELYSIPDTSFEKIINDGK